MKGVKLVRFAYHNEFTSWRIHRDYGEKNKIPLPPAFDSLNEYSASNTLPRKVIQPSNDLGQSDRVPAGIAKCQASPQLLVRSYPYIMGDFSVPGVSGTAFRHSTTDSDQDKRCKVKLKFSKETLKARLKLSHTLDKRNQTIRESIFRSSLVAQYQVTFHPRSNIADSPYGSYSRAA